MTGMQIIRMVTKRPLHYILNTDLLTKGFHGNLQREEENKDSVRAWRWGGRRE
jgi:hypothetical protein